MSPELCINPFTNHLAGEFSIQGAVHLHIKLSEMH